MHNRQAIFHAEKDTRQRHRHNAVPTLQAEVFEPSHVGKTSVIKHHIQTTVGIHGQLNRGLHTFWIGRIHFEPDRFSTARRNLSCDGFSPFAAQVRNDDGSSFLDKTARGRRADA